MSDFRRTFLFAPRGLCRAAFVLLALCMALGACGGERPAPSVRLILDGPPLAIAAVRGETPMRGLMERSCMAGVGDMRLTIPGETECSGSLDHPGNAKGRLYIRLDCLDGSAVILAMRNLGPDQGMGVGKQATPTAPDGADTPEAPDTRGEDRIVMFYHPSANEARRRLTRIRSEIDEASRQAEQPETENAPARQETEQP